MIGGGAGITVTLVLPDDIGADASEAGRTVRGQEESSLLGVSVPSVAFFSFCIRRRLVLPSLLIISFFLQVQSTGLRLLLWI